MMIGGGGGGGLMASSENGMSPIPCRGGGEEGEFVLCIFVTNEGK